MGLFKASKTSNNIIEDQSSSILIIMGILLLLLLLPIFFFFLVCRVSKNGAKFRPPGPPGLPFIGNLHQLDNSFLQHQLWKLSQKYGPLMSLQLGSLQTLVVSSAKMAKEVMKTHDLVFCSRPPLFGQQKFSYNGKDVALSPYNDYWRQMKKMVTLNLFSSKRVQSFRPIREEEVSRTIAKVSELVSLNEIVNLSEIIISLTSTIICRIAFSKQFDEGFEASTLHGLMLECEALLMSFYVSDYFPFLGWLDKLSGLRTRLDKNFKEMDSFYQQLIDEHLDTENKESMQEDFIDVFLQLINDKSYANHLTLDNMKAVLMDILLGGTDTSASVVIWTMTELMRHPTVMDKAQEEVRKLINKKGMVNEDDLQNLPYLKIVVKEAMRLQPPVPLLLPRVAMEKCRIDGYDIQPNTMVYVNVYAIGRDPECWKNPEEFLPERFLGTSIDYKGQDFELVPFGAGRRGCPGISMGSITVELILSNLLYSFDWKLPLGMMKEDIDFTSRPGATVHKKIPLCLRAEKVQ